MGGGGEGGEGMQGGDEGVMKETITSQISAGHYEIASAET